MSSILSSYGGSASTSSDSFYVKYFQQRETPKCFERGPQCITTALYYFECCEDDCCARVQPMVKIIIVIFVVIIFLVVLLKSLQRLRKTRKLRRNGVKVQSLLYEHRIGDVTSKKKDHIAIQCW